MMTFVGLGFNSTQNIVTSFLAFNFALEAVITIRTTWIKFLTSDAPLG